MSTWVPCWCGRGDYDDTAYGSCYECYQDRVADLVNCIWCGRLHGARYATCFKCRQVVGRDEAGAHLRLEILSRDHFRCSYCGDEAGQLQVDHAKPCARGGTADPWNLQALCVACNRHKGATWVDSWSRFCPHALARQRLVEAYYTYLWRFLNAEQRNKLQVEMETWLGAEDLAPRADIGRRSVMAGAR